MTSQVLDVVIIGAGLSGIGCAVHLQRECPDKQFALLESRDAIGGTWDLFRYPGIRSDSDMLTLGYNFKPWTHRKLIADGDTIRDYIQETADEHQIKQKIRFRQKVVAMDWSSRKALWTLTVKKLDTDETVTLESRFVFCCAGYYKYEQGFTPEFEGREDFGGQVIHPQHWPEDFDYSGKRIVVIGSGATAVTLVPALADKAARVTMLQRSPTYVASVPQKDPMLDGFRKVFSERTVYRLGRGRNVLFQSAINKLCERYPDAMRAFFTNLVRKQVGPDFDMRHFEPSYNPWEQRLCAVPDGDMFKALRKGKANIITDHIERFVDKGILLKSGFVLEADVIVTATGLEVQLLGGMTLSLDGQAVSIAEKMAYKGAMLEDIPNLVMVFGYTNSSWTLKADLIADYTCRVLNYMDEHGYAQCTPRNLDGRESDEAFLNLSSGYIQRVVHQLPKQGVKAPWKTVQNYFRDYRILKLGKVNDGALIFNNPIPHGYGYPDPELHYSG